MSTYTRRKLINNAGYVLAIVCVLLAIIPLGAMIYYVLKEGGRDLTLSFFTQTPAPVGESGGGMSSQIVGTIILMIVASIIGLPVGILSGIYLARAEGTNRFASTARFCTDVIAGTPSIVAGVVAYAAIVVHFGGFGAIPGGVALALLMFPTVTRATEAAIDLVPEAMREAGLALGVPEWATLARIILPAARSGIITAIMLGIARVAGETAPLYLTAFGNDAMTVSLQSGQGIGALPLEIWKYAQSPYVTWHQQAWAGAFVLFALIVILNLSARLLTSGNVSFRTLFPPYPWAQARGRQ